MDQQVEKSRKKRGMRPSRIVKRTDLDLSAVVAEAKLLRQASRQVHRELVDSIGRLREALSQSRKISIERLHVIDKPKQF
ncbi:MAG TPA: hypothetical protein VE421_09545 [Burkholderiaceae bacterium]|jgi:hypothetical protein|nr:hypothetical protein [Burkholderiaceae bacterium]